MLIKVDTGNKIPANLPFAIRGKGLVLKEDVDIGLIPDTIPPITKVNVIYC